jgi:hypothetical protein
MSDIAYALSFFPSRFGTVAQRVPRFRLLADASRSTMRERPDASSVGAGYNVGWV